MKVKTTVTETVTYQFWVEVPDDATDDQIDDAALEEWGANPGRKPVDYECAIEADYIRFPMSRVPMATRK